MMPLRPPVEEETPSPFAPLGVFDEMSRGISFSCKIKIDTLKYICGASFHIFYGSMHALKCFDALN
jgi:hypothetical protein